jgi:hypothetical protein
MENPMPCTPQTIEEFFLTYQHDSDSGDIPILVAHFAETFLAAGPQGAQPVRAADFALALPKRKQLFDAIGRQSTALVSVQPIPLDSRYTLARTRWRLTFARPNPLTIHVTSDFLIDTGGDRFKILLYLANQDIMQVLRDHGIPLPAPPPSA